MFYPEDVVEDIRAANDIVDVISGYTQLKQKGANYFGLCPFHRESTPSFSVSPDKQLYYCFGCGAAGNVYSFVMQKENYDFADAVRHLADRIHYALPEQGFSPEMKRHSQIKQQLYDIHTAAARFYYGLLIGDEGKAATAYLDNRQVKPGARKKFGLGYAVGRGTLLAHLLDQGYDLELLAKSGLIIPDKRGGYFDRFSNRLMFPIMNVQNKIIGFGGRILDQGEPKYLNSPDTPIFDKSHHLYGLNFARQAKAGSIILVEGYMDVIALYQAGIHNAAAALGTAFNAEHAKLLKKYCENVILLFDSDGAGERAALRAIPILVANGLRVKVLQLQNAKDPDEFLKRYGADAFAGALNGAMPYVAFQVACLQREYDLSDTSQKVRFTGEVAKLLAALGSAIERDAYGRDVAAMTGISHEAVMAEVGRYVDQTLAGLPEPKYKNKPNFYTPKDGDKGVDEARRNVLYVAATGQEAADAIRANLTKEEFAEPFYMRLYDIIYDLYVKKQSIYPAEVISRFEDLEEQKMASSLFTLKITYDTEDSFTKALNDQVRLIKAAYLDEKIAKAEDLSDLQHWAEAKRNLKTSYISGLDG